MDKYFDGTTPIITCSICGEENQVQPILEEKICLVCLIKQYRIMRQALEEIMSRNELHNDFDAYLYDLANYALGNSKECPKPEDYGLVKDLRG